MTKTKEIRQQHTITKARSRKVFKVVPVNNQGKKSCKIDSKTTIFIDVNSDCEVERKKYLKLHDDYDSLYSTNLGGRRKKNNNA